MSFCVCRVCFVMTCCLILVDVPILFTTPRGGRHRRRAVTVRTGGLEYVRAIDIGLLRQSIRDGDVAQLRKLLKHIDLSNEPQAVALLHEAPNKEIVEELLRSGVPVTGRNEHGEMPLHCVQDAGAADLLLRAGAPLDALDIQGRTPLHTAVLHGADGVVERLLPVFLPSVSAMVNTPDKTGGCTVPFLAQTVHVMTLLIYADADLAVTDAVGRTVFGAIATRSDLEERNAMLTLLLQHDALITANSAECAQYADLIAELIDDALTVACFVGDVQRIKTLFDQDDTGVLTEPVEPWGLWPLHAAVGQGHVDVVKVLLEHGFRPEAADIGLAQDRKFTDIAQMLEEYHQRPIQRRSAAETVSPEEPAPQVHARGLQQSPPDDYVFIAMDGEPQLPPLHDAAVAPSQL